MIFRGGGAGGGGGGGGGGGSDPLSPPLDLPMVLCLSLLNFMISCEPVGLTIQVHCSTLLSVRHLFAVSDNSFTQQKVS